jgi:hypothetical protein
MKRILVLLAIFLNNSVFAMPQYNMQNVMLLQPDSVLSERVETKGLSNYIKLINVAAATSLANISKPVPTTGFIVIAVRPGGQSKVWLDFSPTLPSTSAAQLVTSLEHVVPFQAKGGVVVFAINVTLWGAAATKRESPFPVEWQEAIKGAGAPMAVENLVALAWPSKVTP